MRFLKRLGFYLLGFSIGLVLLAYFLKGKNTEFCYSPNCRVLKNINSKKIGFSVEINEFLLRNEVDSAAIRTILKEGDVIFSKSNPRKNPCPDYLIEATVNNKAVEILVENCDTGAFIREIRMRP